MQNLEIEASGDVYRRTCESRAAAEQHVVDVLADWGVDAAVARETAAAAGYIAADTNAHDGYAIRIWPAT